MAKACLDVTKLWILRRACYQGVSRCGQCNQKDPYEWKGGRKVGKQDGQRGDVTSESIGGRERRERERGERERER
jgi:hypothetical protein